MNTSCKTEPKRYDATDIIFHKGTELYIILQWEAEEVVERIENDHLKGIDQEAKTSTTHQCPETPYFLPKSESQDQSRIPQSIQRSDLPFFFFLIQEIIVSPSPFFFFFSGSTNWAMSLD